MEHTRSSKGNNDECYTPIYAVEPLLGYLEKFKGLTIWCPFDKPESNFVKVLTAAGHKVICSHIETGQNFFMYEPEHFDLIISNPPFTNKKKIFERCLSFGKPFALLMSVLWLNDAAPVNVFYEYGLELLMFEERIEYMNQPQDKRISFKSVYFCNGILPTRLELYKLLENKNQLKLF